MHDPVVIQRCAPTAHSPARRVPVQRAPPGGVQESGRGLCARAASSAYKRRRPASRRHPAFRLSQSLFVAKTSTSTLNSAGNGPQLLLLHCAPPHAPRGPLVQACGERPARARCLLLLLTLPSFARLLLLLPRGLRQVCPGLRVQRGLGQLQLLCLKKGRRLPCGSCACGERPARARCLLLLLTLPSFARLLLLLPRGLRQVCPGLRVQRGLGQLQLLCLKKGRRLP
ncbi:hypothetical protein J0S82_001708 [Galemys pyrenaicus]|uniref:Uncharacterized protein n=1 Tax=Galemys pyrenaicus TaxID=202257 RepID=A0A8J5ZU09_GALPY|nr:hypothetical protein J0S82_001708 [Galemys pyrenaicus]